MQQTFPCPNCGAQNALGQRFCATCGQMFQYRCPYCSNIADPASRFCPSCGALLGWEVWQQPGWSPQQPAQPAYAPSKPAPSKPPSSSKPLLTLLLVALLIGLGGFIFWFYGPSSDSSPTLSESESPAQPSPVSEQSGIDPPYLKEPSLPIHLVNNPDARDVSFAELKTFLLQDDTDEEPYVSGVRTCGNFAEKLHNNAENSEIRAAFVALHFSDEPESPHALNAFQTTDRGLVYVDCIGKGLETVTSEEWLYEESNPCENDKVAYIEVGEDYGVISIDNAESLQYSFYVEYTQDWQTCKDMLEDYNDEVMRYNAEISGKVYYEGSPELAAIQLWEAELAEKERMIDELAEELGSCSFKPLGIVGSVEIYW
ncbi:MAG: zinc ribbon domain-containing protein [Dehalococcoidia bacterium]|nr:zinc ribbon domain-containing protein [Dehalococcoidia bacterium]